MIQMPNLPSHNFDLLPYPRKSMPNQPQHQQTNVSNDEQLIPVAQAAPMMKLSAVHLRRLVRTDKIPGEKLGRDWFTTKAAVAAYLAVGHKPGPKPKGEGG